MINSCVEAIVLAGGQSRRMGRNKALLPFGGYETLVEYQFSRLAASGLFAAVRVSIKESELPFDAPVVRDRCTDFAPIFAIVAALSSTPFDRVFFIAVDTPFFDEEAIATLLARPEPAAVARSASGDHPLCGVYERTLLPHFQRSIANGDLAIKSVLETIDTGYANFDDALLANLNTREEYAAALLRK
ncbi:molybdenum cofactor guanylyltransferase [Campylobacterota bacterium]|nr:molybdenum cofactor guanylyltransferase [Campylobacterota bacterium]